MIPHWLLWNFAMPFLTIRELARVRAASAQTCSALMWDDATHEAAIQREFGIERIARYAGSVSLHYSPTHVVSLPLPPSSKPLPLLTQLAPLLLRSVQPDAAAPENENER